MHSKINIWDTQLNAKKLLSLLWLLRGLKIYVPYVDCPFVILNQFEWNANAIEFMIMIKNKC